MVQDGENGSDAVSIQLGERPGQSSDPQPYGPTRGDVFVVLGLPGQFQLGCDTMAMTAPESQRPSSFIGLRDLPVGAHFAWVSSPGAISRQGYWFFSLPTAEAVHVKQWDQYNEVLDECALQDDARFLATEISSLYPLLPRYSEKVSSQGQLLSSFSPYHSPAAPKSASSQASDIWQRLSSCIVEPLLGRVAGGRATTHHTARLFTTTDTAKGETDVLGMAKPVGSTELVFLFSRHDIDPYQLSAVNHLGSSQLDSLSSLGGTETVAQGVEPETLDTTQSISSLLENSLAGYTEDDIIGELQFVFLTGTLISNLSCLEQWWHIVLKVFLRARRLVACHPCLCRSLIQTLHAQFIYLDCHVVGGFSPGSGVAAYGGNEDGGASIFDIKPHGAVRLQAALAVYGRSLNNVLEHLGKSATPEQTAAGQAFADLEAWLWQHGWDLRHECAAPQASDEYSAFPDDSDCGEEDSDEYDGWSNGRHRNDIKCVGQSGRTLKCPLSARAAPDLLYESDDEENQPVLVELDDSGREVGLVSWD